MLKCPTALKYLNFFSNFHFFRSNRFTKINKQKFALVADYMVANCYVAGMKRRKKCLIFLSNLNNAINTVSAITASTTKAHSIH